MDARDAGKVPTRRRRPGGDAPAAASDAAELKVTDLRQPGWSWGWDTLAREFAALLQLKGVGLYFTYATYTDNRPSSPYRGSSYTGVDALAEFTGESADDVRTINKLLAALGLARFQTYTVYTRGKDGRRGTRNRLHCYILERDPHLRLEDVVAVLRLAAADARVYKYVRHVFRPTFRPIDRAEDAAGTPRENPNPWYRILPQVRRTPEWRALALRAERDHLSLRARNIHGVEAAAARRRAGRGDDVDEEIGADETILPVTDDGAATVLPATEDGGVLPVSEGAGPTVLPAREPGPPTDVRGSEGNHDEGGHEGRPSVHEKQTRAGTTTTTTRALALHSPSASLKGPAAGGVLAPEADALFDLFAQANARPTTEVEQLLLLRMADEFERPARGQSAEHSGRLWVMSAIVEAVDAGSPFVSPRRVRKICERWAKEGFRSARAAAAGAEPGAPYLGFPEVEMPNGQSSRTVWRRLIGIARGSLNADSLIERLEPCYISGYDRFQRELEITAPDQHTADKLRQSYGGIVERALAMIFGQPTRFRAVAAGGAGAADRSGAGASDDPETERHWQQSYRRDEEDAVEDAEEAAAGAEEPADDQDILGDPVADEGAADDSAAPDPDARPPAPAREAPPPPPALLELLEPGEFVDGRTTHEAWATVLEALGREVSPFRLRLFEGQTALVGWESEEELLVAGANGFVLDQLRAHASVVLAALRPLVGVDRQLGLRYTTWDALVAALEAEQTADGTPA